MLLSPVFILRPLADTTLPLTLGNAFYRAFLQLVAEHDPEPATWLHDANGPKPFTTSPLQGPVTVRHKQLHLQPDQDYWLRVTSIEAHLSHTLLALEAQPPSTLRLHNGQFAVMQVTSQPQVHPWAACVPYDALYEATLAHEMRSRPQVSLVFESPTAFRFKAARRCFHCPGWSLGRS